MPPRISVVMSVFNGAKHLECAVKSIQAQKNSDFEFIIVNDGSTDKTQELLERIAKGDDRIRVIHQQNQGLTRSLIEGCELARGEYIARQDADDLSFDGRLQAQANFLEAHPDVVAVSSWAQMTGPCGEMLYIEKRPANPEDATELLLVGRSGPTHGSVMFRKSAYQSVGGYRPAFYFAQDSDLWLRMARVGQFAYIQKVYYSYVISPESLSGGLHGAKLAYARLVDECFELRNSGQSDAAAIREFLKRYPEGIRPQLTATEIRNSEFRCNYFIGRCLLKKFDGRAKIYFRRCLQLRPYSASALINMIFALLLKMANSK